MSSIVDLVGVLSLVLLVFVALYGRRAILSAEHLRKQEKPKPTVHALLPSTLDELDRPNPLLAAISGHELAHFYGSYHHIYLDKMSDQQNDMLTKTIAFPKRGNEVIRGLSAVRYPRPILDKGISTTGTRRRVV